MGSFHIAQSFINQQIQTKPLHQPANTASQLANLIATYGQQTIAQALQNLISQTLSGGVGNLVTSPKYLSIPTDRRENLLALFGSKDGSVSVRDNDGDGKISAGDAVTKRSRARNYLRAGRRYPIYSSINTQSRTLTAEDIANPKAKLLARQNVQNYGSIAGVSGGNLNVLDLDGDGRISVGDRVIKNNGNAKFSGYGKAITEKTVTESDLTEMKLSYMATINYDVKSLVEEISNSHVSVVDRDRDGKMSAGDVVELSGGFMGRIIRKKTLTQDDIKNGLPLAKHKTSNYDLLNFFEHGLQIKRSPEDIPEIKVLDKNGDGEISVGDTLVKLLRGKQVATRELTQSDLEDGLPLSYERTHKYDLKSIFYTSTANSGYDRSRLSSTVKVLDKNGDGFVGVGDVAVLYDRHSNQEISRKTITAEHLSRKAGGGYRKPSGFVSRFKQMFSRIKAAQPDHQIVKTEKPRRSGGFFASILNRMRTSTLIQSAAK